MKEVRCPHCDARFEIVQSLAVFGRDKGYDRHVVKCAKMPEKDRVYYKLNHSWPRRKKRS